MKKLILLILTMTLLVGCSPEEPEQVVKENTNKNEEIVEMSQELNKAMYTIDDIYEMGDFFNSYKDRMGDQTYLSDFDLSSITVSANYYREFGVDSYSVKETIVSEKDNSTIIYIAYSMETYITGDSPESGAIEYTITGLNKYNYKDNKLVDFQRVL